MTSLYPELKGKRAARQARRPHRRAVSGARRSRDVEQRAARSSELLWVDDPIEAFFLESPGIGPRRAEPRRSRWHRSSRCASRTQTRTASPTESIGRWLVDRGELTLSQASMQSIKGWAARASRPARRTAGRESERGVLQGRSRWSTRRAGPKGALGVPLTPSAIDRGRPACRAARLARCGSRRPSRRPTRSAPTGSSWPRTPAARSRRHLNGAVRADFFWGFGASAGGAGRDG